MRWPLVLVALAGCTPLFGLDGVVNDDPDGDRIPSSRDNCPDVANPDQSDVNGDGVGDACQLCGATDPTDSDGDGIPDQCDGCDNRLPDSNHDGVPDACETAAPGHDEDGDGVADSHDNCPSVANADQADTNESGPAADGVGNACDDSLGRDLQLFDSFTQPSQLWLFEGPGFQLQGDQAVFPQGNGTSVGFAGVAHTTFKISTHVTVPSGSQATLVAVDSGASSSTQTRVSCVLSPGTKTLQLIVTVNGVVPPPLTASYLGTGSEVLTLSAVPAGGSAIMFTCTAGRTSAPSQSVITYSTFTTGLGAAYIPSMPPGNQASVAFDYFDLVTATP